MFAQLKRVVSLILLLVALMSLMQFWSQIPVFGEASQTVWDFFSGKSPSADRLFKASSQFEISATRPLAFAHDAKTAGTLLVAAAATTLNVDEIERGAVLLRKAAEEAPNNSTVWARLAYADLISGNWTPSSEKALLTSEATGRLELDEMKLRIWVGIRSWEKLSERAQNSTRGQIQALWSRGGFGHRALGEVYSALPSSGRIKLEELTPDPDKSAGLYQAQQ